jgi:periplasmic divalent cation tolerance protein
VSVGEPCLLYLTCANEEEAKVVADALLSKRLVACASSIPVTSWFSWKSNIETNKEVLLIMKSRTDLFNEVEDCVQGLHSYETFVLEMTKLDGMSSKAVDWLEQTLRK